MDAEGLREAFERRRQLCQDVLIEKNAEYATDTDVMHNFAKAADLIGCTPEQALFGFLTKHIISLSDMVAKGDPEYYTQTEWDEKIGDTLNYLFLLDAMVSPKQ